MSYTKTTWVNDQSPAINATNLNKIEQGIYDADALETKILEILGIKNNTWVGTTAYSQGDIVVYNNRLYENTTGTSTTTNPASDTTNWAEISVLVN